MKHSEISKEEVKKRRSWGIGKSPPYWGNGIIRLGRFSPSNFQYPFKKRVSETA